MQSKIIFIGPLSPDIQYYQKYPKRAMEENLNRALKRQNKKRTKNMNDYYFKTMKHLERVCASMQLPKKVLNESLLIVKTITRENETYFEYKIDGDYRRLAVIKIACQLCNTWFDSKELVTNARDHDGRDINLRNNSIKRKIDREMMDIKKMLGIHLSFPDNPTFLGIACRFFSIPEEKISRLYLIYQKIKNKLNQIYKLEGYLLALIYLNYNKDHGITITKMESEFGVARDTIRKRKDELLKLIYGMSKNG